MIFNRTISDVNSAKQLRANKMQKGIPLTDVETEIMERGCITINTLNRIEEKQSELKKKLNDMGYYNAPIINKKWGYTDIFTQEDLKRLVGNDIILRDAFYVYFNSPKNAIAKFHYEEINAIEKILFDISRNIDYTINNYKICGTVVCGG